MLTGLFLSMIVALGATCIHILIVRFLRHYKLFNLVAIVFLFGVLIYLILYFQFQNSFLGFDFTEFGPHSLIGLIDGLVVYVLFFLTYVQCMYYFTRPVTIRMVTELYNSKSQTMTLNKLRERYNLRTMIESRLNLLVLHGFAKREGEWYSLTRKGCAFARLFILLRQLFGIPYYLGKAVA